ncbi:MarR family winged helix-turn-helix transcriptional regulator [Catellatospora bangladeshensis]|uniref:MarR family winged helix-turn-helix transcriptional regulator n=1 Tax=Catellatospora bangladeshensis TaxID=310355 RepID=UPI00361C7A19
MDAPQDTRWLSAEERQTWLALAALMIRLPSALDAQLQRDAGLSHFEYQVLAALSEAPERTLRMSRLAMLAEGSLSRLSQVVARLEQRGWVRRTLIRPTGASRWPCSPTRAGTRSWPPLQRTWRPSAAWSSTRSPRRRPASCATSAAASCTPSTPATSAARPGRPDPRR